MDWTDIASRAWKTFAQAAAGVLTASILYHVRLGEPVKLDANDLWAALAVGLAAVFSVGQNVYIQKRRK